MDRDVCNVTNANNTFLLEDDITDNYLIKMISSGYFLNYGKVEEGTLLILDIIRSIEGNICSAKERNILIWCLYSMMKICIEEEDLQGVLKYGEQAEKLWSRELMLEDKTGVYHISWLEQILLRKAEAFIKAGETMEAMKLLEDIIQRRHSLIDKAERLTGDTIALDRCLYTGLFLQSQAIKGSSLQLSIDKLKAALEVKTGYFSIDTVKRSEKLEEKYYKRLDKLYSLYVSFYNNIKDSSYDIIKYMYCGSCRFNSCWNCTLRGLRIYRWQSCDNYELSTELF